MNATNICTFQRDGRAQSMNDSVSSEALSYQYNMYSGGQRSIRFRPSIGHNYESISNDEEADSEDNEKNWFSLCLKRERQSAT